MATPQELRKNLALKLDDTPYQVVDFQHVKPGKGAAFTRTTLRNISTGESIERTFHADEQLEIAQLDKKDVTFLSPEGTTYAFMDSSTYEQYEVSEEVLGQSRWYLESDMSCLLVLYEGSAIAVEIPTTVVREIVDTTPPVKENTSGNVMKPARIPSGLEVQVPQFCAVGDKIKIDTRTGDYLGRIDERARASSP
ncbi:hypothetical protein MFUL124B02_31370 [Myxococcus fulvus 124B02]|nr:hypothetical protein MFUL124B02_31370 [Myxococcus fulvus 124B02]